MTTGLLPVVPHRWSWSRFSLRGALRAVGHPSRSPWPARPRRPSSSAGCTTPWTPGPEDFHTETKRYPEALALDLKKHALRLTTHSATSVVVDDRLESAVRLAWYRKYPDTRVGKAEKDDDHAGSYSFCLTASSRHLVSTTNPLSSMTVGSQGPCPEPPAKPTPAP